MPLAEATLPGEVIGIVPETPSPLVLVESEETVDISVDETERAIAEIMDPGRVSDRRVLRTAAEFKYPHGMPTDPDDVANRVAYLAATGKEFRSLYPTGDDTRTRWIQWSVVEKIAAMGDNRFNVDHPHYDDALRLSLHNQLAAENSNVPEILRAVGQSPDGNHKMGLSVPIRDGVAEMLYDKFPYFDDALEAAQRERGFGDDVRSSLARLYQENRIENMVNEVNEIDSRVTPYQGPTLFDREYRAKLVGGVDADGNRTPGKIDKAVAKYSELTAYPIPQGSFQVFSH